MTALRVGHASPRFVSGLAGLRDGARPPQFLSCRRVVSRNDASIGTELRLAAARREDLPVRDKRSGCFLRWSLPVIEDPRFPSQLARDGVQSEQEIIGAGVDNLVS